MDLQNYAHVIPIFSPDCDQEKEFECKNKKCIRKYLVCNSIFDCIDASDEQNCPISCRKDQLLCKSKSKCLESSQICDGNNDCPDGSDEFLCHERFKCKSNEFQCENGLCIPDHQQCNKINDCKDNSDELSCLSIYGPKSAGCSVVQHQCDDGSCILRSQVCDNKFDCLDLSDEIGCKI
ncbi:Suppressor of tumorigenicity 14 protein [Thelohanellus kitauei]|uniref:Suppressor of tumorigenicity 14 protein n=1 Tax=Thelohanellus kitauei TaxID=669202 RepID=A0A0C2ITX9_THEKT|nr:Suppressor of tumorigenicity 14 protein [Thelohanellus kitauei]